MNIEIIKSLKERAKEMLEDNYDRKIGDEEIYTIICELENFYTAYEKEKEKNKRAIKYCKEKSTFQTFGDFELRNVLETYINRLKHTILDILEE